MRSLEKKKELENSGRGSVILGELLLLLRFMVTLLVTIFSVIWRFARNFSCICLKSYAQCDCVLVLLCFVLPTCPFSFLSRLDLQVKRIKAEFISHLTCLTNTHMRRGPTSQEMAPNSFFQMLKCVLFHSRSGEIIRFLGLILPPPHIRVLGPTPQMVSNSFSFGT